MKILHVNIDDLVYRGGATMAAARLHKSLLSMGVESKLLLLNKESNEIPQTYDFREIYQRNVWDRLMLFWKARRIHGQQQAALKNLPRITDPFSFPRSPFDITKHPLYEEADIVHFHWVSRFLDYPSFFSKNSKPIVWTTHDREPMTGGEHCFTNFPYESYQKVIDAGLAIKKHALSSQNLTIVSPSVSYMQAAGQSEVLSPFKARHIPHGVSAEDFRPADKEFCRSFLGVSSEKKVLLFAATSVERKSKGLDLLLSALDKCKVETDLLVIGEINSSLQLSGNVTYLGSIKDQRMMRMAYVAADLFISPSLEESFGLSIAESLLCGTPVVGFDVGANPELIKDGINGKMIKTGNHQILSNAIESELMMSYSQKSVRESVLDYLDIARNTQSYIDIYKGLI